MNGPAAPKAAMEFDKVPLQQPNTKEPGLVVYKMVTALKLMLMEVRKTTKPNTFDYRIANVIETGFFR